MTTQPEVNSEEFLECRKTILDLGVCHRRVQHRLSGSAYVQHRAALLSDEPHMHVPPEQRCLVRVILSERIAHKNREVSIIERRIFRQALDLQAIHQALMTQQTSSVLLFRQYLRKSERYERGPWHTYSCIPSTFLPVHLLRYFLCRSLNIVIISHGLTSRISIVLDVK